MSPLTVLLVVVAAFFAGGLLVSLRTGRPDGNVQRVHPYRRLMFFIMPTRNESVVYFDAVARAEKLEAWVASLPPALGAHLTHALVAAAAQALADNPRMNRFVAGRRLYERKGRFISFSMKRKKLDKAAKLSLVKLEMKDGETFDSLCERMNGSIGVERSGEPTHSDKEYALFDLLPNPVLWFAHRALVWLDYHGMLPGFFIRDDAMYTSLVIANLGSIGMAPGYHHHYEWGTSPLFIMVGKVEDRPVVEDGKVVAARVVPIRFTYDERIDDGLTAFGGIRSMVQALEDPERWLGHARPDGTWSRPVWPHPPGETPGHVS